VIAALATRLKHWFPDRQIMVREGDRIAGFRVSTHVQAGAAGVLLIGALWAVISTALLFWHGQELELARADVDAGRSAYQDLVDEVAGQQSRMQAITRDLEGYRGMLVAAFDDNQRLQQQVRTTSETLEITEVDRHSVAAREQALRDQLIAVERRLFSMAERQEAMIADLGQTRSRLLSAESERQRAAQARLVLERRQMQLEADLATATQRGRDLDRQLAQTTTSLDSVTAARRQLQAERDQALERAADAVRRAETAAAGYQRDLTRLSDQNRADLARLTEQQRAELARLAEQARGAIQDVERIVGAAGLDLNRLAPQRPPAPRPGQAPARTGGSGGPFVPWSERADAAQPPTAAAVQTDIERLEILRQLVRALPIAQPLTTAYSVQSGFGYRLDPFNGRPAMHEGVDLGAPRGTPVVATAGGTVLVAEWRADYGRMVEIDHGHGFRTRYAHLDAISVRTGDRIAPRQAVGTLGNTGRSTGPHLHYEVLHHGRHLNPATFLRVIADVSQNRR
jgi:murein DD-endopeptidase MepM/ murein hydrolase activator NlpD